MPPIAMIMEQLAQTTERVRVEAESSHQMIQRKFVFVKIVFGGLTKNTVQLRTLLALSSLCVAR